MSYYTINEGRKAVEIARKVLESHIRKTEPGEVEVPEKFQENAGVFTTISRYPSGDLRGCIGYSEPLMPIIDAIINTSKSASTNDPRFLPVKESELDQLVVSVSLLTKPVPLVCDNPNELPGLIDIGKHGLIMRNGNKTGLLLPQVPQEFNWNPVQFLTQTCKKAGLSGNSWKSRNTAIHTFTAEVFEEMKPKGKVVRKK